MTPSAPIARLPGRTSASWQSLAPWIFSGWFEAYLDGQWYTFGRAPQHSRIGRIVLARGRDAADVAISTAFGKRH